MSKVLRSWELIGPALLVVAVALVGTTTSDSLQLQFRSILVTTSIVVALHVFVGNSGVISFGHVSFVAIGAFGAGVATTPVDVKPFAFPELFPFLRDLELGNVESLLLAAALGENDEREDYLRATLSIDDDGTRHATPLDKQDSSVFSGLARADCLIIRAPFAAPAKAGDPVRILPLGGSGRSI